MIFPNFLKDNDLIGVTAPSDGQVKDCDIAKIDNAIKNFKSYNLNIVETDNVRTSNNGRSSDALSRYNQLKSLVEDDSVKMILMASGGDFLCEMLPYVDYSIFENNPKWIQGYSDITGLTYGITTICDVATIYSSNYGDFGMKNLHSSVVENIDILKGNIFSQSSFEMYQDGFIKKETGLENYELTKKVNYEIITGQESVSFKGRQLGGCLDVLLNLVGTPFENTNDFIDRYNNDKTIFYLESFSLDSEWIFRGLWQLKMAGWFRNCSGFIFGRPAFFSSYTDTTFNEAVLDILGDMNVPIITGADIGHKPPRMTIINGALASWNFENGKGRCRVERE